MTSGLPDHLSNEFQKNNYQNHASVLFLSTIPMKRHTVWSSRGGPGFLERGSDV